MTEPPRTQSQADLRQDYRVALLRFASTRDEAPLRLAYELGRSAVTSGVSLLDLAQLHHELFLELLADSPAADAQPLTESAARFFLEVLATFDMVHRSLTDRQA